MSTLLVIFLWITGIDSLQADWMRERYHRTELIHYLEAMDDHTIVETHTTGGWTTSERKEFSVEGLGYTQNRYYIDGFRVDDKFQPGSSRYIPNMQQYNMQLNYHTGQLYFQSLSPSPSPEGRGEKSQENGDYVEVSGNVGGLNNEPAAGTAALIHLFHRTPMESADNYQHISARRHIRGAGSLDAAYTIRGYRQHVTAGYGNRAITKEDENGLITDDPFYTAQYYYVQADGRLPKGLNYMVHFAGRDDGGSENLYNYGEVYQHRIYTGSVYYSLTPGPSPGGRGDLKLTTGVTWATNTVRHENPNFSKNIIDQDGESFEPWMPDGDTHELTWNLTAEKKLTKWLRLVVDASNSLLYFKPTREEWQNTVYLEAPQSETRTELYTYNWHTRAYASGLMENTVGLQADYAAHKYVDIHGTLNLTLDGMLLGHGKSKVSPNIEAAFRMEVHPCKWFQMGLAVGHYRQAYTAEQMRYFSNDYMYTDDGHGGKYHEYEKGLKQTAYVLVDLPIKFRFTSKRGIRHEIALQQSAKKFYHVWYTRAGEDGNYVVGYTPTCGYSWFTNTPYYFSQLTKYTLESKHVVFSIGWQSMLAAGYSALGNGANSNNNGVLSESTAIASTSQVISNPNATYPGVGRLDMDKGFVCRIYVGYNICRWVQVGVNLKWTDGKPFTAYRYAYADAGSSSSNGSHGKVIITPLSSRGTNPTDGNFGTRNCANWQADVHVQGCWWIKGQKKQTLRVEAYNVWDFGCDQAEMCFYQDIPQATRSSMILNVPTGLLVTFKTEL